jgi:hypothetical protein
MKKKLYYVVTKQLQDFGEFQETTGWKTITVYEIVDNQPKIFAEIEARNVDSTEGEIQFYLDNNGYDDEEFELINL